MTRPLYAWTPDGNLHARPEPRWRRLWYLLWHLLRSRSKPTCEICHTAGVTQCGDWDYCPHGHTYVGQRTEQP